MHLNERKMQRATRRAKENKNIKTIFKQKNLKKFWKTKHFKFAPEREEYAESHEESQQGDRIACKVKAKDVNLFPINLSHKEN